MKLVTVQTMPANRTDLSPPVHHVFVDFENMHTVDLAVFDLKPVSFTLLLGARQTKLDVALVEKLMEHAAAVQLVRLTGSGRNALDFTLAYYVGRAVVADSTGHFHIISKDSGFDPLVEHLRSRQIHARRHADFAALAGPVPAAAPPSNSPAPAKQAKAARMKTPALHKEDRLDRVVEHLRAHPHNRPRRKTKLISHLTTVLGNKVSEAEVVSVIEKLGQQGRLTVNDKGAVTYQL